MPQPKIDKKAEEKFKQAILKSYYTPLGWEITGINDLLKKKLPASEFIINNLIPENSITILAGNPSSYKSWLLLSIAISVGSGGFLFKTFKDKEKITTPKDAKKFLQFASKQCNVLYIDEEASQVETQRRLKLLNPPPATTTDFMNLQGFRIDDDEKRKALLDFVEYRNYKLIIFDSLRDLHGKNENDSTEAQAMMDYFKEFTKQKVACLICHHNRKESALNSKEASQILRGSSAILAGVDSLLAIENTKATDERAELLISQPKLRQGRPVTSFKAALVQSEEGMKWEYLGEIEEETRKIEVLKEKILEALDIEEMCRAEVIEAMVPYYYSESSTDRAIKELKADKLVTLRKEGRKTYFGVVIK